jgi:hypothetical protein
MPGISMFDARMPFARSSAETFGTYTRRFTSPSPSTVGVKSRLTPNFLNSMVISLSLLPTGIGYSPPARKLAVSPDKRHEVRLRQRADHALLLQRPDLHVDILAARHW